MPQQLEYPRLLFRETQRFAKLWVWLVGAACSMVPVVVLTPLLIRKPKGAAFILTAMLLAVGFMPLMLSFMGLRTIITSDEFTLHLFPLRRRRIPIAHIVSAEAEDYHPFREFGGWGVKFSLRDSTTAYTVRGERGVRVQLSSGEKILIGSQRADELAQALKDARGPV